VTASFKFQSIVLLTFVSFGCSAKRRPDELAVIAQIKQLHELATVRYSVQRVVGLREQKVPFGEEWILLMVEGRVTAGVDLARLSRDNVRYVDANSVMLELPAAQIFDVSLDEKQTKVWDRQITWWTPWVPFNPELEHHARLQAIEDVRNAALQMGILDQAQHNAETAIRDLLTLVDLKVSFRRIPS
jgi:hypothetical protein